MFQISRSVLLIIDVQGKLAQTMFDRDMVYARITALIQAARLLDIPILVTEQAPEKIGTTVPEILSHLTGIKPIPKTSFSCCGSKPFLQALTALNRPQIIISGIETHVCVYQTVADLLNHKYKVQVVADAVSSRTEANRAFGLTKIRDLGAELTVTEMIITELLRTSEHEKFRDIIKLIK